MNDSKSIPAPGVNEAVALVSQCARPLETEVVPLSTSLRRVLREDLCAPEDQPSFDRSAVDGYAVSLDDPSESFTIVDSIRAGQWKPRRLERGQAVRIATGAALPCPALQVVMKEDALLDGDTVKLYRRDDGPNIRFRGDDARQGQVLIKSGAALHPGALALLASMGCAQIRVTRLPRVIHAATGDEIVPPDSTPAPGQIRDSNSVLVRAFLNQWQIEPRQLRLTEAPAAARAALAGNTGADILLVSGGASVGEHDFTRQLLEELGFEIRLCQINARPGKPLIFGARGNALAFGLPGNPLAHFVCLNLFVRAAIDKMSGLSNRSAPLSGTLGCDLENGGNSRETLWPVQLQYSTQGPILNPLRWSSSGDLTCLAGADALARIPAGCQRLSKASTVEYFSTRIDS